jgi:tetraprenyl-beta-curcumene synthase
VARARRLHSALLAALDPERAPEDHYALCDRRDDGGYLEALVERCRAALAELPSYPTAAVRAQACAARIVCFQSLSQGPSQELERWARSQTGGVPLAWWELAAAAGSSLAVHALIAAAGAPTLDPARVDAIEGAYFTPIGALHSLLDSVVDREEDMATGQPSLIAGYRDPRAAAAGLGRLARASRTAAMALDRGPLHESLVAAMACHYLATLGPEMDELVRPVRAGVGPIATPAMLVFRAQASLRRCTTSRLTFPRRRQAAAASPLGEKRGIDARAA